MSSLPFSALLSWSQLFSSLLMSPERFSSLLISSPLFSAFLKFSQLVSTLLISPRSCQLILCLLISFLLLSHLLSSPHISSADLRSCQLVSPHLSSSQRTRKQSHLFSRPKPAPKTDLDAKASNPYAFHREDFTQKTFTHSKLLHREAWTHRSFCTGVGKILFHSEAITHTASFHTENLLHAEAVPHSKLLHTANFCTQPAFTHSKHLHTEPFTHSKFWHTAYFYTQQTCTHSKLSDTESLTHRSFCTQQTFTHSKLSCKESSTHRTFYTQQTFTDSKLAHAASFYTDKLLHTEVFTQRSPNTDKHVHRGAFTHRSLYTQKLLHIANFHTQKLLHTASFYTELGKLLFTESFYTEKPLHTTSSYTEELFHSEATLRSFYTEDFTHSKVLNWENLLTNHYCNLDAATPVRFTMSSCKGQQYYARSRSAKQPWRSHYNAIRRRWVAKHKRTTCNSVRNWSSKTGSRRQSRKKMILKHFWKGTYKENHQRENWKNLVTNHYRSLDAAIPLRFTMSSCKRQQYYARSRGD